MEQWQVCSAGPDTLQLVLVEIESKLFSSTSYLVIVWDGGCHRVRVSRRT